MRWVTGGRLGEACWRRRVDLKRGRVGGLLVLVGFESWRRRRDEGERCAGGGVALWRGESTGESSLRVSVEDMKEQ